MKYLNNSMIKPELVDYIKKQLSNGHDTTTIREHLLKHGYTEALADEGLIAAHAPPVSKKAKMKYFPFSSKALAYLFVVLAVLGIGFGTFSFYSGSSDLAGAAQQAPNPEDLEEQEEIQSENIEEEIFPETTTTETTPMEEEIPLEETVSEEEMPLEETVSETNDIQPIEESSTVQTTENLAPSETEVQELALGCTSNSACSSGSVCYQHTCEIDTDHDGASDAEETAEGTDIHNQDSDADSYFDSDEFSLGTNALDKTDPGYTSCTKTTDCASGQGCGTLGICMTCKDSDSENYKKQGTIRGIQYMTGKIVLSTDSCSTNSKVTEYYCNQGYSFSKSVDCETEYGKGYSCSSGKCVKE